MLERSIGLLCLLGAFWLPFNSRMLLASQPPFSSYNFDRSVSQKFGYSFTSANQPILLEISLSHRRVTLYRGMVPIKSYPIAIGRAGWQTPVGRFQVAQKIHNPIWIHPLTGQVIAGGSPDNPLGHYWIEFWTDGRNWIGFHGY